MTQCHWASSRSLAEQVPNLCRFNTFLKKKHQKFLLNTETAYDQRMFIDLEPRSFGQVRGQWEENCKFVSDSYDHNFLMENIGSSYLTKRLLLS